MQKSKNFFNQAFVTAFLVTGAIAVTAVIVQYSGNIQLKFGADGIQLQITGHNDVNSLDQ
ncbi:MAG: hypothetical protein ICV78_16360 [Tolypothrix sp. Co-bin9]|nr:hypothetical protein [Tolypothrix sp. Co-bin9]